MRLVQTKDRNSANFGSVYINSVGVIINVAIANCVQRWNHEVSDHRE